MNKVKPMSKCGYSSPTLFLSVEEEQAWNKAACWNMEKHPWNYVHEMNLKEVRRRG